MAITKSARRLLETNNSDTNPLMTPASPTRSDLDYAVPGGGGSSGSSSSDSDNEPSPLDMIDASPDTILEMLKQGFRGIQGPTHPGQLFGFLYEIRQLLTSDTNTAWLLDPVPRGQPDLCTVSVKCAGYIRQLLPKKFAGVKIWPQDAPAMIALLQAKMPDSSSPLFLPSYRFPEREKTESMIEFLERLELWVAAHLPEADTSRTLASRVASMAWAAQRPAFDTVELDEKFIAARPTLRTLDMVMQWMQAQRSLQDPAPTVSTKPVPSYRTGNQPRYGADQGSYGARRFGSAEPRYALDQGSSSGRRTGAPMTHHRSQKGHTSEKPTWTKGGGLGQYSNRPQSARQTDVPTNPVPEN